MKILELFSGMGKISQSFLERGHEIYRIDWSEKVEAELHADISKLTVQDILTLCDGLPDIIWASPQCTTYSIATHRHRTLSDGAISELAKSDDLTNIHMWKLIDELVSLGTKYYFVENPQGRMRHADFVKNRPRFEITYCSYGNKGNAKGYEDVYIMKKTDIWSNHPNPNFLPKCSKPYPHIHGDWGKAKKRDYISRGEMPKSLCDHIASISEVIPTPSQGR